MYSVCPKTLKGLSKTLRAYAPLLCEAAERK